MTAKMPPAPIHDTQLRPLGNGDRRTIIATFAAQDFITALFEDLQAADWQARLERLRRRRVASDGVLALNQPIHRRFQIALFEAWCAQPGRPRLDPARIAGSGLVVRRLRGNQRQGWMKRGKFIDGWTALDRPDFDPDPKHGGAEHAANAAILSTIAARKAGPRQPAAETIHALYPAPPEVCEAVGRTVLFAAIPVVSTEVGDLPTEGVDYRALPSADRKEMVDHFSEYLKARPELDMPKNGQEINPDWNVLDVATMAADPRLHALGTFLHQLLVELDALGSSRAASDLMAVLRDIRLPTAENALGQVTATMDAAEFVRVAGPILIGREANSSRAHMPLRWPQVSAELGVRLADAALACLTEQHKARVGPAGKFADESASYVVRGFIRVSGHDDCPDRLVWSMESEPFRILPWWDGEGPGTTISLPDMSNLKKVKPSVTFAMPPAIANLLKGDMKKLSDGEKVSTGGPEIAWLCSFSIPFITICAFIVLNIFLTLLDIVFRWMMFIKICIPIPKPASPPPSGGSG